MSVIISADDISVGDLLMIHSQKEHIAEKFYTYNDIDKSPKLYSHRSICYIASYPDAIIEVTNILLPYITINRFVNGRWFHKEALDIRTWNFMKVTPEYANALGMNDSKKLSEQKTILVNPMGKAENEFYHK